MRTPFQNHGAPANLVHTLLHCVVCDTGVSFTYQKISFGVKIHLFVTIRLYRWTGLPVLPVFFFSPNTLFFLKGAYRTHRFSVISVILAKYWLLFSVISVIPAKYRLLFSVISVIPAFILGNTGSPTVASMCDLLRIQKPVYRYLPVFFSGISKTVLGRYRYSLVTIPLQTINNNV